MRFKASILLLVFSCAQVCFPAEETLHGFVLEVSSTGAIQLDDFAVERDNRLSLEINSINTGSSQKSLNPGDIRVGDELEISGDFKSPTHQLKIDSVKILSLDARKVEGTVFPDKPPELEKIPAGWSGTIFAEGLRIQVTDSTAMTYHKKPTILTDSQSGSHVEIIQKNFALSSLDGIGSDTMTHFEGISRNDGTILATKVDFEDFELLPREVKLRQKLEPVILKGDALINQPDELQVGRAKFRLARAQNAQEYLQRMGESLIPLRQRELRPDDPLKIPYRFYVAEDKDFDIVSFPSGVIVVKSGLLASLEDEAQLAFHLSRAIALVEEAYLWRMMRNNRSDNRIVSAALAAGFGVTVMGGAVLGLVTYDVMHNEDLNSVIDQQDRLALEWMLAEGYDIREAPRAYKAYVLTHPDRTPISPKPDPNQTEKNHECAVRRSALMAELRTSYSKTQYSSLKKDSDQFHGVVKQIQEGLRP